MSGLLVVPYNDSMRLGQGYNSFLQTPGLYDAVVVDSKNLVTKRAAEDHGVPQVVSYSSRFVDKISDVTRSMNISAGSSIKNGSITMSGNSLSIDESKFSASDLNAVVSVKVINQTTYMVTDAKFNPNKAINDNKSFREHYGDCFISGFIEGGDLHGIVSIKVLDASQKEHVKSKIKGRFNVGSNSEESDFNLNDSSSSSAYGAEMWQSETTISVNWSGGGQIKKSDEEWSLDLLFRVAAGFPAKVAKCPQRTWAILTRYSNNHYFHEWAVPRGITPLDYSNIQRFSSDLLDDYMEYKNNLLIIQNILAHPENYTLGRGDHPVPISVQALVHERAEMKKEMAKIIVQIDELNEHPELIREIDEKYDTLSPEVWATRLPMLKSAQVAIDVVDAAMSTAAQAALSKFNFVTALEPQPEPEPAPTPAPAPSPKPPVVELPKVQPAAPVLPPAPRLCSPDAEAMMTSVEKEFVNSTENKERYRSLWLDKPQGSDCGLNFNDCESLITTITSSNWAQRLIINFVSWESAPVLGKISLQYEKLHFTHGSDVGRVVSCLDVSLGYNEKITHVRYGRGRKGWGTNSIGYFAVWTSGGQHQSVGDEGACESVVDCSPPGGSMGLKGFFGSAGDVVDRIGVIWG